MTMVDFTAPAVAFWSNRQGQTNGRRALRLKNFPSLSEAVRFLVEDKIERHPSCTVETENDYFSGKEIDLLYQRSDFPKHVATT